MRTTPRMEENAGRCSEAQHRAAPICLRCCSLPCAASPVWLLCFVQI